MSHLYWRFFTPTDGDLYVYYSTILFEKETDSCLFIQRNVTIILPELKIAVIKKLVSAAPLGLKCGTHIFRVRTKFSIMVW